MLHLSTKIVVIGSNVKRKAGPRVGSIGFVSYLPYSNLGTNAYGNNKLFASNIVYTRYGYEKKSRFEKKSSLLLLPNITADSNTLRDISRTMRFLNTTEHKQSIILVSPVVDQRVHGADEFCAKIYSKMCSPDFIEVVRNSMAPGDNNESTKLFSFFPRYVKNFIDHWMTIGHIKQGNKLIYDTFANDDRAVEVLFTLINACEMLSKRFRLNGGNGQGNGGLLKKGKPKKFGIGGSWRAQPQYRNSMKSPLDNLAYNIFKPYGFQKVLKKGIVHEKYVNNLVALSSNIKNKGVIVINKHK